MNTLWKGVAHALAADEGELALTWGDGIGDNLLLSAVAHEWKIRTGKKAAIYTKFPELFEENLEVVCYPYLGNLVFPFRSWMTRRIHFPVYAPWDPKEDSSVPPDKHIIAKMCEFVGLRGTVGLRPYFPLSTGEMGSDPGYRNAILIQTSVFSARLPMKNKEWYFPRFQQIVDVLRQDYQFIQIGSVKDPTLRHVTDLRGKTTIRQLARLMRESRLFVGLVGFLMHLARANECPSVIVYGGREHPHQSGYICNENIARYISCSPCWLWNRCDYNRRCMSDIMAHEVIEACRRQLQAHSRPLPVEECLL